MPQKRRTRPFRGPEIWLAFRSGAAGAGPCGTPSPAELPANLPKHRAGKRNGFSLGDGHRRIGHHVVDQREAAFHHAFLGIVHIVGIGLAVVENHTVARDVIHLAAPGIGGRIAQVVKGHAAGGRVVHHVGPQQNAGQGGTLFPVVGKQIAQ